MDNEKIVETLKQLPIRIVNGLPVRGEPRVLAFLMAKRWIIRICGPERLALTRRGREALEKLTRGSKH